MARPQDFSDSTKLFAAWRQNWHCAMCGQRFTSLGRDGRAGHRYGEAVHAHHIKHCKLGGTSGVDNCVILCDACHYCAHEGGNYGHGTVVGSAADFPGFAAK